MSCAICGTEANQLYQGQPSCGCEDCLISADEAVREGVL
jgi:hypothetical protein